MKKLIFALCLAATAGSAFANDVAVNLVKRMYAEARNGAAGIEIVEKYADSGLKKALRAAERSGDLCVDADPMWDNQDP